MTKINVKTAKKKRVSKKNKISWRKHVDITDVEEFLEEQRLDERLGPALETLPDNQLFTVDTKPSTEEQLSAKERKRLKFLQPLKCYSILQPHTKVPDPITKRNRVRSKEERKNVIIKKKDARNRALGIFKHKELQGMHDRQVNELRARAKPKRGEFDKNIWDDDEELAEKNKWFTDDTIKHNLVGTGKGRKIVKNPKKTKSSVLPSVEVPHPGMSYNPSFDDHTDLLKTVAEKEKKIIKEEEHLNRVTRDMFGKVTVEKRDANWLKEMSEGLPEENKIEENNDSDGEYKALNPPTKNKKKTLQQRRKQKEQIALALQREAAKIQRRKISDIHKLKQLKEQIHRNDGKLEARREIREKVKLIKKKEPKRLSAMKFEESDLDFNLGQDIAGNLRNLKKEGNLLADRFKSMQKRNIIQPTIRKNKKKSKVKIYTKPGHKDDWIKTVAR